MVPFLFLVIHCDVGSPFVEQTSAFYIGMLQRKIGSCLNLATTESLSSAMLVEVFFHNLGLILIVLAITPISYKMTHEEL